MTRAEYRQAVKRILRTASTEKGLNALRKKYGGPDTIGRAVKAITSRK